MTHRSVTDENNVSRRSVDSRQVNSSFSTLDGIIDFGLVTQMCEERTGDQFQIDPMTSTFENMPCEERKEVVNFSTFGIAESPNYNGSPYSFSSRIPSKMKLIPLKNAPSIKHMYEVLNVDFDPTYDYCGIIDGNLHLCILPFGRLLQALNIPYIPSYPEGVIKGTGDGVEAAEQDALQLLSSLFDFHGVYHAFYYRSIYSVLSDFTVDILVKAYMVGKIIGKKFWSELLPISWKVLSEMLLEEREDGEEYVIADVDGKDVNLLTRNYAKEFVSDFISDHIPYYISYSYITNYPLYLLSGVFRSDGPNLLGRYCFGDYRRLVKHHADGSPLLVCDKYHGVMYFIWMDYFSKGYNCPYSVVASMDRLDKSHSGFSSSFALGRRLYETNIYKKCPGITEDINLSSYMDELYAKLRSNGFHNCWSSCDDRSPKKNWCESFLALVGGIYRSNPGVADRMCDFFYVKPNYTEKEICMEAILSYGLSRTTGKKWSYRRKNAAVAFVDGKNIVVMSRAEMEAYVVKLVNPERSKEDDYCDEYDAINPRLMFPSIWSFHKGIKEVEEEEED